MYNSRNPFAVFKNWHDELIALQGKEQYATKEYIAEPACLSTCDSKCTPSSRMILIQYYDENGFTFFTNYNSPKAQDIACNNNICLTFFWHESYKQIRIEGIAQKTSEEESDQYFASRSRDKQISTYASNQSSKIESFDKLKEVASLAERKFSSYKNIPRPQHWGGFKIIPNTIEFWDGNPMNRLHKRTLFSRKSMHEMQWDISILQP